jgi:Xaa-Pro dipeptidase
VKGTFQLGKKTLAIPMDLHQASREKLCDEMRKAGVSEGVVLLEGGKQLNQYDTDTEPIFRQDSWFNFLFGVKEPDFFGAVDIASGKVCRAMSSTRPSYALPKSFTSRLSSGHPSLPSHLPP